METGGLVIYISKTCEWIMRMAYLNILWLLFSVLGIGIFGIVPATVAVLAIQRKWLQEKEDIPIFSTFWKQYKENFVSSNILGTVLTVTGIIIYFDFKFFLMKEGLVFQLISLAMFILSIWYLIVLLYIFPIFVHYKLRILQNIRFAFYLGMLNPIRTIGLAVSWGGMVYLVLYFPKLLLFFGISLPCFILMLFVSQALLRLEKLKDTRDIKAKKLLQNPRQSVARQELNSSITARNS